ncbi:GtrA family protein [Rhodobacteraceae bacterium N5(2021)]|uniref:GtrA family protein n=1 Tax=Gymnodinialimonas phycosphaerae TaxID=2841589 RepID=A0A975YHD8_9RHOB|nr:GtrA family protein [Gymnodinialimonas phycosphaerae]MBY4892690.1 GtrA family protein [Gymnodinialimonas phycosphaerae]
MTRLTLVTRYVAFAMVATAVNLLVQRIVLLGGDTALWFIAALGAGTLAGLVVKYALDKRWIFYDTTTGTAAQGKQFGLYSLMGVITTVIFWVTETAFWMIWGTDFARELGAIIGLTVGYVTKYQLDKRFVFQEVSR